ncbi:MAG: GAF domain-containing protein, partial [Thermodesulfobacteriota bacterium]
MVAKNDYFKTICEVSLAFGTTVDREELLKLIVQSVIDTMKAKAACLWLIDEERGEFIPASQKGLSEKYFHLHLRVGKIASIVMKEGYLHARDATTDPRLEEHEAKKAEGISSMLIVPVMVKNKVIGILSLYTATPRDFSKDEIRF